MLSSVSLFLRLKNERARLLHGQVPDDLGDDHVDDLGVDPPRVRHFLRELRQFLQREEQLHGLSKSLR